MKNKINSQLERFYTEAFWIISSPIYIIGIVIIGIIAFKNQLGFDSFLAGLLMTLVASLCHHCCSRSLDFFRGRGF